MTSSLYVQGTLAHNQRVLVDVGTLAMSCMRRVGDIVWRTTAFVVLVLFVRPFFVCCFSVTAIYCRHLTCALPCLALPALSRHVHVHYCLEGTGYYIEKTVEAASDFFSRRASFLKTKIEELQPVVMNKVREKGAVEEALQARMSAGK